jgi:hypothetical protein
MINPAIFATGVARRIPKIPKNGVKIKSAGMRKSP